MKKTFCDRCEEYVDRGFTFKYFKVDIISELEDSLEVLHLCKRCYKANQQWIYDGVGRK